MGCILGFGGALYFVWGTHDHKASFDAEYDRAKVPLHDGSFLTINSELSVGNYERTDCTEKNTNIYAKWGDFLYTLSFFFLVFRFLEGDLGCILGFGGVLYFVWGTYDHKASFDTEYDRVKVRLYDGSDPRPHAEA